MFQVKVIIDINNKLVHLGLELCKQNALFVASYKLTKHNWYLYYKREIDP